MNFNDLIRESELLNAVGWTLLHSLWQLALIGLVFLISEALPGRQSAKRRYLNGCITMSLVLLLPLVTLITLVTGPLSKVKVTALGSSTGSVVNSVGEPSPVPSDLSATPTAQSYSPPGRQQRGAGWRGLVQAWLPSAVIAWLIGVSVLTLRPLLGWRNACRLRVSGTKDVDAETRVLVGSLAERLGIRRLVDVVESSLVSVPTLVGSLKPLILLPGSVLTRLSTEQLEAILAHELAHVRRHDHLINIGQTIVETLFFFHPVVWWISHRLRVERENCCDDLVVELPTSRAEYARALANLAEAQAPALAMAANQGSLVHRIRRILGLAPGERRVDLSPAIAGLIGTCALGLLAFYSVPPVVRAAQNVLGIARVDFEVKVVDSITGVPVEGFVLYLREVRTNRTIKAFGRSDANGRLVIKDVEPGQIELRGGDGEMVSSDTGWEHFRQHRIGRWWTDDNNVSPFNRRRVRPDGTQRNFGYLKFDVEKGLAPPIVVVERAGIYSGRVSDPDGNPVADATVDVVYSETGFSVSGDTRFSVRTKVDGSFRIAAPASNTLKYNLLAHDGEPLKWRKWANGVTEPMIVAPGQVIKGVDIRLTRPGKVFGRLNGTTDAKMKRQDVFARPTDKRESPLYLPRATTEEDGSFVITHVRPGQHRIQPEKFGYNEDRLPSGVSKIVTVSAGGELKGVEIGVVALPATDEKSLRQVAQKPLKVQVIDSKGTPVVGAYVGHAFVIDVDTQQKLTTPAYRSGANGIVIIPEGKAFEMVRIPGRDPFLSDRQLVATDSSGQLTGSLLLKPGIEGQLPRLRLHAPNAISFELDIPPIIHRLAAIRSGALSIRQNGRSVTRTSISNLVLAKDEFTLPPGRYQAKAGIFEAGEGQTDFELKAGYQTKTIKLTLKPSKFLQTLGKPARELRAIRGWLNGGPTSLQSQRGKVVILDFWNYRSHLARAGLTNLVSLHNEFSSKGVVIIGIHDESVASTAELTDQIEKLKDKSLNGQDIPYLLALDGPGPERRSSGRGSGATWYSYGVGPYGGTLLIDQKGKVVTRFFPHDLEQARDAVESVLAGKDPKRFKLKQR